MQSNPKVSIVIPHYNRFDLLKQTLNSVYHQTYSDWEIIVVDDYSTSECLENIKIFIENESRIQLVVKKNELKGAPASRNLGLNLARGFYVLFLDADDVLAPFALEQRVGAFTNANQLYDAVIAPTLNFKTIPGDLLEVWSDFKKKNSVYDLLEGKPYFQTMGPLWKKNYLNKIGGWHQELKSYQDWELHIRALLRGMSYKELEEHDNFYRIASDEHSIASRYFQDEVIRGRFDAFKAVYNEIKTSAPTLNTAPYRAYVIRQFIQLIDHDKINVVSNLLKSYRHYGLTVLDQMLIRMMLRDGSSWRYRKVTKFSTNFFWSHIDFDPWNKTTKANKPNNSGIRALNYNYKELLSQ